MAVSDAHDRDAWCRQHFLLAERDRKEMVRTLLDESARMEALARLLVTRPRTIDAHEQRRSWIC